MAARFAVVGAGITGSCTAWWLARAGAAVTLFEQGPLPNPWAASYDRHRLIRYPYGDHAGYCAAITDAHACWDALWDDLGERHYVETGSLALSYAAGDWTERSADVVARLGLAHERLDAAEVGRRFPFLRTDAIRGGLFMPRGGVLLADRIMHAMARRLPGLGVALRPHARVSAVDADRGTVRVDGGDAGPFDGIVVACGPWTTKLLSDLAPGELTPIRQLVVYLRPPPRLADAWACAPALQDIGGPADGYGVPPVAGTDLKLGATPVRRPGDPDAAREPEPGEGRRLLDLYRDWLVEFDGYELLETRVCHYMLKPDERFLAKPVGRRAWVATGDTGHGFKFGPLLGRWLADAVTGRMPAAEATARAAGEAL